jgi:GT2 family glycosyltransferase
MKACVVVPAHNHWWADSNFDKDFTKQYITRLAARNPNLDILLLDNFSGKPYPTDIAPNVTVKRLLRRVGYAVALNIGLQHFADRADYDWYICTNNDCWIDPNEAAPVDHGRIESIIASLDPCKLYGSGVNEDKQRHIPMQWSAWLCISRNVFQRVGLFDEKLAAAFEDFDYELRAMAEGFELDTAKLPIVHLNEHTRFEDKNYPMAWNKAAMWFSIKHNIPIESWFKI